MSKFFIHRPIFAWVISIFVILAGVMAITKLPVSQFPTVAPPTITVTAAYPGATAQTMTDSVLQLIEREMNGANGMMYMETSASATGSGTLTVTFEPGTNQELAQVDVFQCLMYWNYPQPLVWKMIPSALCWLVV